MAGAGGIGAGIVGQQATSTGSIEEFRAQLALARMGDTQALAGLVGTGQQAIQAGRTFAGSGQDFAAIFKEVNVGLSEVKGQLTSQRDDALQGLEDVGR